MRVFLAVHPGERFRRALSARLDPWRARLPLHWTRPATWHLTLQFLGDWPPDRVDGLCGRLDRTGWPAAFTLRPGVLDAFPDLRRPRVLFLQMEGDGQAVRLADRVRAVVDGAWPEGPQDTRPFRPHLTLARVREPLAAGDLKSIEDMDLTGLPEVPVEEFRLVVSALLPQGARHRERARWGLRKKGE